MGLSPNASASIALVVNEMSFRGIIWFVTTEPAIAACLDD
jgi:hypothetical protein